MDNVTNVALNEEEAQREKFLKQVEDLQSGKLDDKIQGQSEPIIIEAPDVDVTAEKPAPNLSAWGYTKDIGMGMASGVTNAVTEIENTVADLADWANNKAGGDPEYFSKMAQEYSLPDLADPQSTAGKFAQSTTQFLTGFIPAFRAMRAINGLKTTSRIGNAARNAVGAGTAGAVADFSVWDPTDERISNFAQQFGDATLDKATKEYLDNPNADSLDKVKGYMMSAVGNLLSNRVTNNLAAKEGDSPLQGRSKQAVEGVLVGKLLEPIFYLLGTYGRAKRVAREEAGVSPPTETATVNVLDPTTQGNIQVPAGQVAPEEIPKFTLEVPLVTTVNEEQKSQIFHSLIAQNYEKAGETFKGILNLQGIKKAEDVDTMLSAIDNIVEQAVVAAKRGKISLDQTAAASLGLGDNAMEEALARVRGIDANIWKTNVVDQAIASQIKDLAMAKAAGETIDQGLVEDLLAKAFVVNQYVHGSAGELGRAMNVRKYFTQNGQLSTRDIFNSIKGKNYANADEFLEIVAQMPDKDSISKAIGTMGTPAWRKVVPEIVVNGLLSPITYTTNLWSNFSTSVWHGVEIANAAARSQAEGGSGAIQFKEAGAYYSGLARALGEGFTVMARSYWHDAPMFTKQWGEYMSDHAIVAETFGKGDDTTIGKAINWFGKAVRGMPGATRSLMATDELFKTIIYRAKVNQLATREAFKNGLEPGTMEFKRFIDDINTKAYNTKPGEKFYGISMSALDEAHINTFTEELGTTGQDIVKTIRKSPETALVLPFVKTPVNIFKYQLRRTPLMSAFSDHMQAEIAAGGARKEMAEGQIAMGAWILTTGMALAAGGALNGDFSVFGSKRQEAQGVGVEPGTLVDSDGNQFSIGRFAPMSDMLMVSANTMEQINAYVRAKGDELDDDELEDGIWKIMATPILAFAQTAVNKPYFKGVADAINSVNDAFSSDENAASTGTKALQRMGSTVLPFSGQLKYLNQTLLETDPVMREATDTMDLMARNIPYLSNDLPPKVDNYGDPIKIKKAIGWGVVPVPKTQAQEDPIKQEVARLKRGAPEEAVLGNIPKAIDQVSLEGEEKYNFMQIMKNFKDGNGDNLVAALGRVMDSEEYKSGTDSLKRKILTSVYNGRKKAATEILKADIHKAYKGEDRPYAEKLGLYKYKRNISLATILARKKGTEIKNLYGSYGDVANSRDDFVERYLDDSSNSVDLNSILQ